MTGNGFVSLDDLASRIGDGAVLAIPPDYSGVAMAATRLLLNRRVRNLHVVAVPTSGLQAEWLIGGGCVGTLEAAAITLGEFGPAPRFVAAIRSGAFTMKDSTCPAVHAGLQAAEKGVPFMPLRGLIGSDILKNRGDWRVVDNPFGTGDPIVLLPAIKPDFALFHALLGDRAGNVWIGRRRELMTMAHAAKASLVTVERIYDGDLLADETMAAGTLPGLYVGALAHAPRGAWPLGFADEYAIDTDEVARYVKLARTTEGFDAYMAERDRRAAAE
jgi:glutaconate CoA-transferase subunit A